jgi:uncharacterized protein with beta-barrel porin domain
MPIDPHGKVGVALTESFDSATYNPGTGSQLLIYSSQANFYAAQSFGPAYIEGVAGGAYNTYDDTRGVAIGTLSRAAVGKWSGWQYGGAIQLGVNVKVGAYTVDPYVQAQYLKLYQNGYSEQDGGAGVDLTVGSHSVSTLNGTGGVDVSRDFSLYYDSFLQTDLRASYTHQMMTQDALFGANFTASGTAFDQMMILHGPNYYSGGFSIGHKDSFSSITLDYDADIGNHYLGHVAAVSLRFRL